MVAVLGVNEYHFVEEKIQGDYPTNIFYYQLMCCHHSRSQKLGPFQNWQDVSQNKVDH